MFSKYIFVFLVVLAPISTRAMTFESPEHRFEDRFAWINIKGGIDRIYARGRIEEESAEILERFVAKNGIDRAIIFLDSAGGSLSGALKLGKLIRKLGFDTGIGSFKDGRLSSNGVCASACAYVFAGGIGRYYEEGNAKLGLHQFYALNEKIDNQQSQQVSGLLVAYLQNMGIDALAYSVSASAGPNEMIWLTPSDALRLKFSNNGKKQTIAEIKMENGITYLKIEQERIDALGRFLFNCIDGRVVVFAGMITTEENSRNKMEWATQSYLSIDGAMIQREKKGVHERSLVMNGQALWVSRLLAESEIKSLLSAKEIGIWVASDGAMAYGAAAEISEVKEKLRHFLAQCRRL